MPVHPCHENGKPGYQWGGHGKCYTYTPGNEASRKRAKAKAESQGQAAHASGYRGGENEMDECPEYDLKALPNINPNEDEQTYVSRCIKFETERSPDRDPEQIQRMCYEKYREATGGKKPSGVKKDIMKQIKSELEQIKADLEELKKSQIKN
jgi:hypothetical protein